MSAGQPPCGQAVGSEAGEDVALGQCRQRPERAQPEAAEHVDQLRPVEGGHGERGQEPGGATGRDDPHGPGGLGRQGGGEDTVGDAHLHLSLASRTTIHRGVSTDSVPIRC